MNINCFWHAVWKLTKSLEMYEMNDPKTNRSSTETHKSKQNRELSSISMQTFNCNA